MEIDELSQALTSEEIQKRKFLLLGLGGGASLTTFALSATACAYNIHSLGEVGIALSITGLAITAVLTYALHEQQKAAKEQEMKSNIDGTSKGQISR